MVNTSTSTESQSNNTSRLPRTGEDNNGNQTISFAGILLVILGNLLGLIGIKKHRSFL
ncbi:hypothetical protein [Lactiplantibacillus plantarum]|uniref:hypothetical protein n=1 Tax=Lactiplantibacillus plantarum TaxID=1590 RepID=UPI0015602699|nr:hypothetical protein [Lactiplantibacillus plantarum]